jgi:hypothetical protein
MRIRVLAHAGGRGDERVRRSEPLTFGVPLPRGSVNDQAKWTIEAGLSRRVVQIRALDRWPDGSIRWALVDTQVDLADTPTQELFLDVHNAAAPESAGPIAALATTEAGGVITIDTGAAKFELRAGGAFPFASVEAAGHAMLDAGASGLSVTDAEGAAHRAEIATVEIEERGSLRTVVKLAGTVRGGGRRLNLLARVHFFAGLPTVRLLVTLRNPDRAQHPGGFWDLGDAGSILIKDASLSFQLHAPSGDVELYASPEIGAPWTKFDVPFELYQDSSGGDNWQSSNHLNRERRVPATFRGYRVKAAERAQAGLRATPIVALARGNSGVAATASAFWQNFPKAIEADASTLTFRLFPGQFSDLHEIQGGEQKTHELFVAFGPDGVSSVPLAWCRSRTIASVAPDWCVASNAVPFLAPLAADHAALVNSAVDGPDRFEVKREKIDEYGWRHFGEIYGDHEAVKHKGATPLVSHYNNQYDPIAGFAYQFLRTGDPRWWTMMSELAWHVIDIDVYHTNHDKSAYNHGMFWHTYHYGDADTSTHRTFPKVGQGKIHGGGPAAGHNYASGLMIDYFLTGDEAAKDIVVELAQFVSDLDDGRKTVFRWLDSGDTGHAALSATGYYGPGRGPANSLAALLDGHRLTGDRKFLEKAERLVRRVIHPQDDITARRLDVTEQRWFYTMFLQSLGRYLQRKAELGEIDAAYAYARASLLHYAAWMVTNEHPYLDKPDKLEFPTETWPAQDIRKSDVFQFAALLADPEERARFLERATFFHGSSVTTLRRLPTRTLARPVVVLLTSGHMQSWAAGSKSALPAAPGQNEGFGSPEVFVPQRKRAERRAMWLGAAGAIGGLAVLWMLLFR